MGKWGMWTASAIGAVGAGAGLAWSRRRRGTPPVADAPDPQAAVAASPVDVSPPDAADDPQAALDAARRRLRDRADDLRRRIEGSGEAG
jgi:predicted flap endonuclease-1-like 5' DNA nuclease